MISSFERRRPRKSIAASFALTALLSGLGPAASAMTVGLYTVFSPVKFEDILPADCLIFGSVDLPESTEIDKLSLQRLLADPEVKEFAGSLADRAKGVQSLLNKIFGDENTQAGIAQISRIGFSVGGVRSVTESGRAEPSLALAIEVSGDKKRFLAAIANLRDMAARGMGSGRSAVLTERRHTYAGQEITELSLGTGVGDLQVAYTLIDSLFVAAADPISVQSLVDNYRRPPERPLSRLDTFLKSRERAGGDDAALVVFFNVRAFRESYLEYLGQEECANWKALGLDDIDGVCYTLRLDGSNCDERIFVHAPPPHEGWLARMEPPKTERFRSLDLVSRDSSYYSAWKGDWSQSVAEIESLIAAIEPDGLPALRSMEKEFERITGVEFRGEFLPSLGEEVSLSALIQPGSLVPYALLTVQVSDPAKFETVVTALANAAGFEAAPTSSSGSSWERIRQFVPKAMTPSLHANSLAMMAGFGGFLPSVLQEGDTFLIASHPSLLTSVVAGGGQGVIDPMRSHQDIARALAESGGKPSSLEIIDLRKIFTLLYGIATPMILSVPRDFLPFDPALLPTSEAIARHLTPATMTTRMDREGFLWRCASPLPFGAAALATVVAAAVVVAGTEIAVAGETVTPPDPVRPPSPEAATTESVAEKVEALERNARRYELQGHRERALATIDSAIETAPAHGGLRFARGCMRIAEAKDRKGDKAILALAREDFFDSIRLDFNQPDSHYNVACTFALEGRKDEAFAALRKALASGFGKFRLMREDSDLNSLRNDARFAALVREIESGAFRPQKR